MFLPKKITHPRVDLLLTSRTDPRYLTYRNRHYVSNNGCHGQQLHYLAMYEGRQVGIISGASSVYGVKARDEFFGLSQNKDIKKTQLCSIINNVVYRIENAPKNAATQILAYWRKQIALDWEYLYQVKVAGFETFVIESDIEDGTRQRTGALYRADNWSLLGLTTGNSKSHSKKDGSGGMNAKHTRLSTCKKLIYAKKIDDVPLATHYSPTWNNPIASKQLFVRRQNLFLARSGQISLFSDALIAM